MIDMLGNGRIVRWHDGGIMDGGMEDGGWG